MNYGQAPRVGMGVAMPNLNLDPSTGIGGYAPMERFSNPIAMNSVGQPVGMGGAKGGAQGAGSPIKGGGVPMNPQFTQFRG